MFSSGFSFSLHFTSIFHIILVYLTLEKTYLREEYGVLQASHFHSKSRSSLAFPSDNCIGSVGEPFGYSILRAHVAELCNLFQCVSKAGAKGQVAEEIRCAIDNHQ